MSVYNKQMWRRANNKRQVISVIFWAARNQINSVTIMAFQNSYELGFLYEFERFCNEFRLRIHPWFVVVHWFRSWYFVAIWV